VRAPIADADRPVDHDGGRLQAVYEGRGIDIGLERRTGLALRVGRPVELAFAVIAPADNSAHGAVIVHHGGRGLTRPILPAIFAKRFLDRVLGLALQIDVEAGAHDEDALLYRFRQLVDELLD